MAYFQAVKCRRIGSLTRGTAISRQFRESYHSFTLQGELIGEACRRNSPTPVFPFLVRRLSTDVSGSQQMDLIRQLREKTSAPIKDVKSCLVACNWDIDAAHKELRKKGVVLAMKKSSRMASEGLLALAQADKKVAVIELNCETDFVARNEIFQYLASLLARTALSSEGAEQKTSAVVPFDAGYLENKVISLDHPKLNGETTVQNAITEVAAMVGENVKLRRGFTMSASPHGIVSTYLHTSPKPGLGRLAGLVTLEVEKGSFSEEAVQRIGSSLAMHVVAARPLFLSKELVSQEAMNTEREVLKCQAESTGKSQMAIEKMVEGRLRKYYEEAVFLEQKYVLNDSIKIKSILDDLSKEVGSPVNVGSFLRVEVGEGIQRSESTEEAAAQVA